MKTRLAPPDVLHPLIDTLARHGVRPVLVGGYVRDAILGMACKDIDIECFGVGSLDALAELLSPFGPINSVGKSFGVLKLKLGTFEVDLSLPRTETKTGSGHNGFEVASFERFDFKTAAKRRDFTVNAVGYDLIRHTWLDPFGGRSDLQAHRLRCVDPSTFVEDPLRLLRAVQFAARFELTPDKQLLTLAHKMVSQGVLEELPKERIFEEMKKLLLKAERPSVGLHTMDALHITPFFPALDALKQQPDRNVGNAWAHTLNALDAMALRRTSVDAEPLALMLGTLCLAMKTERSVCGFLAQLTDDKRLTKTVLEYVRYHGEPDRLYKADASDAEIMRLACHVRIDAIAAVAEAGHFGAFAENRYCDAVRWLLEKAKKLGVLHAPRPALLGGDDLIAAGLRPSAQFKAILDRAYNAQLEGTFSDKTGARAWLAGYLSDLG
jgi:tRNA nucleotidyltransferase (CCA-adding enzyme)